MNKQDSNSAIEQVLLERFVHDHLPRVQEIESRVDAGEKLDSYDIQYLEKLFTDAKESRPYFINDKSYENLAGKIAELYHHITETALANERAHK